MKQRFLFSGGLGNQLLEYALYDRAKKNGKKLIIDNTLYNLVEMHNGYELDRVFGINDKTINHKGLYLHIIRFMLHFKHNPFVKWVDGNVSFDEVLHSKALWLAKCPSINQNIEKIEEFVDSLTFQNIDEANLSLSERMQNCNSVSIHVRRGDYYSYGMPIIGEDYYNKAIDYIKQNVDNPVFFVFSDDKGEAEKVVEKSCSNYAFIDINHGNDSYKDMYLMSKCKHNIIANSTFSLWGAFFNKNTQKIVIKPKNWGKLPLGYIEV